MKVWQDPGEQIFKYTNNEHNTSIILYKTIHEYTIGSTMQKGTLFK